MENLELLNKFYKSFKKGDAASMVQCYHLNVEFQDPAFGQLRNGKPAKMWEMLLSNKEASPQISFDVLFADKNQGEVEWVAEYFFGPDKRKVINRVKAEFKFKDGKIINHKDSFNLWIWSRQALGVLGLLIGWTPFMRSKIQKMANSRLNKFIKK